jgi:hypothetical protein
MTRQLIMAVKEMLDRHWDIYQMASKLKLDPAYVQAMVDVIKNTLT